MLVYDNEHIEIRWNFGCRSKPQQKLWLKIFYNPLILFIYRMMKFINNHIIEIIRHKKYRSKRALGFCCSRQHAEEMAKEFCKRGIEAVAVYSNADGEFSEDRDKAIEKLKKQEIKMIFSVDMFNEGVDIAALDMVMFLRPTESPIVFLQQLGRGLRISKGKEYLNVLDFIGNYEKAPLLHLPKVRAFHLKIPYISEMDFPLRVSYNDLEEIIRNDAFKKHMKDILEYRTMDYYRRRYEEKVSIENLIT